MNGDSFDAGSSSDAGTASDKPHWQQVNQVHYDRGTDSELATTLVFAIAEAKGVDPLDYETMPPLYDSIDAEALEETFFGPSGANTDRGEVSVVSFRYDGYKVVIQSDGWIQVSEPR